MSNNFIEPAGDYVFVIDGTGETMLDGITLPDNVRQKEMLFGVVVWVGPEALLTKPEDLIMYGPYAGKTVIVHGTEYRVLRQGQIEAYMRRTQ